MKRKLTKAEHEKLSDELKAAYKKSGANYLFIGFEDAEDDEGGESEAVASALRARDNEVALRKEAQKARKEAEDALEAINGEAAKAKGDVASVEKSWKDKLAKREGELTAQIDGLKKQARNTLINGLADTLSAELFGENAKLGRPHVVGRLDVEFSDEHVASLRVLDGEGKKTALTPSDLKKEFLANADFSGIIKGTSASGGGGRPNGGPVAPVLGTTQQINGADGKPLRLADMSPEQLGAANKARREAEAANQGK